MPNRAKRKLRAGDLARVIMSGGKLGSTLYRVETIGERGHCTIREVGSVGGKKYAAHEYDTSLLHQQNDWQDVADVLEGKTKEGPALLAKLFPFGGRR
jgi:hypothetical protein